MRSEKDEILFQDMKKYIEELEPLIELNSPKPVVVKLSDSFYRPFCDNCGSRLDVTKWIAHCPYCGQKLAWDKKLAATMWETEAELPPMLKKEEKHLL